MTIKRLLKYWFVQRMRQPKSSATFSIFSLLKYIALGMMLYALWQSRANISEKHFYIGLVVLGVIVIYALSQPSEVERLARLNNKNATPQSPADAGAAKYGPHKWYHLHRHHLVMEDRLGKEATKSITNFLGKCVFWFIVVGTILICHFLFFSPAKEVVQSTLPKTPAGEPSPYTGAVVFAAVVIIAIVAYIATDKNPPELPLNTGKKR